MAADADMVLLSPACSSLDMYRNFAERGEVFAQAVHRLSSELGGQVTSIFAAVHNPFVSKSFTQLLVLAGLARVRIDHGELGSNRPKWQLCK